MSTDTPPAAAATDRPKKSARTRSATLLGRAFAGLVAAGSVLAVGELLAVPIGTNASPFFAVGSFMVDNSPEAGREFAIKTFGTNDKLALFIGMSIGIAVLAVLAGILERARRPIGSAMLVALGAVGVFASLSRAQSTALYALPTIIGALVGIAVLRLLTPLADRSEPTDGVDACVTRRRFLTVAVAIGATAAAVGVAGRYVGARIRDLTTERQSFTLPRIADPAMPVPAGVQALTEGMTPFITSNDAWYRIDTALQVPQLSSSDWSLRIHGMVDRPTTLSFDDLLQRKVIERVITQTCVSNPVGGILMSTARFVGCPIKDLLEDVGVHADSDMLLSTSIDGWTAGTPVELLADGRDALLAVAMNGEALPLEHGYPVRMVVPGLYGFVSGTKWVVDWEFTRFDRATAYWTDRGWSAKAPIKTSSRIDVPKSLAAVPAGTVQVAGAAWAQRRGIKSVEVRVDGGPWSPAALAEQYSIDTWRQWTWQFDAAPGTHNIQVRATDNDGYTQTEERADTVPDGATGWHSTTVRVV